VHLDQTLRFRVNSSCESVENIVSKSWFALPPVMEWYYKSKNVDYLNLPPFREDCVNAQQDKFMDFIYPKANTKVILAKDFNGKVQPAIFKVALSNSNSELFWYVDQKYLGATKTFHEMPVLQQMDFISLQLWIPMEMKLEGK